MRPADAQHLRWLQDLVGDRRCLGSSGLLIQELECVCNVSNTHNARRHSYHHVVHVVICGGAHAGFDVPYGPGRRTRQTLKLASPVSMN